MKREAGPLRRSNEDSEDDWTPCVVINVPC